MYVKLVLTGGLIYTFEEVIYDPFVGYRFTSISMPMSPMKQYILGGAVESISLIWVGDLRPPIP